jgi:hypothetical protein
MRDSQASQSAENCKDRADAFLTGIGFPLPKALDRFMKTQAFLDSGFTHYPSHEVTI